MWTFVFLAQNLTARPSVSRRTIREKRFFGQEKRKKVAIERLFSGLPAGSFVEGCQSRDVYEQRSIFRYYVFCQNLPFPNLFRSWSRSFHHSWRFISAVSSKLVSGCLSYIFWWSCFNLKVLVFVQDFLGSYGNIFFMENSNELIQTAI